MKVYLFKLRFEGPVHFGDTGIDLENVNEIVNSDTFFSALVNIVNIHYGLEESNKFVDLFIKSPPFLITSLFVFNKNDFFLPKPLDDSPVPDEIKKMEGKKLKSLKWIESNDFYKWQSTDNLGDEDIKRMSEKQDNYRKAFKREIRPRVTLDRTTNQSSLYHCGYVYFDKDAGLYGLVVFYDEGYIQRFQDILKLLGKTGIGGERTYGCGMFEVDFFKADSIFMKILTLKSKSFTLLSLYHPSGEEKNSISEKFLSYDIIRKKGWIVTGRNSLPLKRKSVGFICEGSVASEPIKGSIVDVTPDGVPPNYLKHNIYRYGYAFTAPLAGGDK